MPERYFVMIASGMLGGFTRWVMTMAIERTKQDSIYMLVKSITAGIFLATVAYFVDLGWGVFKNPDQSVAATLLIGFTWQIMMPFLDRWAKRKTEKAEENQ